MTFQCIFKLIFCFTIYTRNSNATCTQINLVVFFADSSKIPSSTAGLKFLEMQEMARVKHSLSTSYDTHPYLAQRNTPNCKELLREGLESLTHFCQNALGMKTAVLTVSSHSITNDLTNADRETQPEDQLLPRATRKSRRTKAKEDTISRSKKPRVKDIITSPEHTEVFNIRMKRDYSGYQTESKLGGITDVPLNKEKSKPPWDVLDVMSHVRFSFFGNLFEDEKKKKLSKEENEILTSLIGQKKQDPGLFESVKSTLATLQETGEAFLMVVFGGHLSELCDKHSPLVQSLKHVDESTDPKTTLIVVTGACPQEKCDDKKEEENLVVIKESFSNELTKDKNTVLPVYAKGPKSDKLTHCTVLYDIPLVLKDILQEISPTFGSRK